MALIIDGYNLLNATDVVGRGGAGTSLLRSRNALLDILARRLAPEERGVTTVVFDAGQAPPGLPRVARHQGMTIRFAARHREADDLIEELIRQDSAPRRLTVVSSDHRLQRAARRRRASTMDSGLWFRQLLERPVRDAEPLKSPGEAQPLLSDEEMAQWLEAFDDLPQRSPSPGPRSASDRGADRALENLANPFPPGYAEDLLDKQDSD